MPLCDGCKYITEREVSLHFRRKHKKSCMSPLMQYGCTNSVHCDIADIINYAFEIAPKEENEALAMKSRVD